MEEVINQEPVSAEVEPSGLPSDVENQVSARDSFTAVEDADFDKGLYNGRWNTPKEMSDYIKNMEDKYSNLSREVSDKGKAEVAEIETQANDIKTEQVKKDTLNKLTQQFMDNGMVMTPEMEAEAIEVGYSNDSIKVSVYEAKEAVAKNAGYVGGQENYDIIMSYHRENMSDLEKQSFRHSAEDPNNSQALMMGLKAMYEENNAIESTDRVRGDINPTATISGYGSKAELFKDKRFADSKSASSGDKARFKARLNATPEDIWR